MSIPQVVFGPCILSNCYVLASIQWGTFTPFNLFHILTTMFCVMNDKVLYNSKCNSLLTKHNSMHKEVLLFPKLSVNTLYVTIHIHVEVSQLIPVVRNGILRFKIVELTRRNPNLEKLLLFWVTMGFNTSSPSLPLFSLSFLPPPHPSLSLSRFPSPFPHLRMCLGGGGLRGRCVLYMYVKETVQMVWSCLKGWIVDHSLEGKNL